MNITIVGLGVIGGSFAMAFKEAGFEDVYAVDLKYGYYKRWVR